MTAANRELILFRSFANSRGSLKQILSLAIMLSLCVNRSLQAKDELPSAESVLDRYVDVTGGREAYDRLASRVSIGTMEFVSHSIRGRASFYHSKPGRFYSLMESEAFGNMEEGTNGNVAWANSLMAGPRLKKGPERAYALRQVPLDAAIRWQEHFENVEFLAKETIDGVPCFKILLTPEEGRPETRFYREDSGLLVRTELLLDTETGPLPTVIVTSDYKKVDGVLIPHKTRQIIAGGFHEVCLTLESIEHNISIPADRFAFPEEVQALVHKEKQNEEKQPGHKMK